MNKSLVITLFSAASATFASIIYQKVYERALGCDFSAIISPLNIFTATLIGCSLMTTGYLILKKTSLKEYKGWYFTAINLLSMLSLIGPISFALPFEIDNPELFLGLAAPMHLLPALSYITNSIIIKYE